MVLCRIRHGNPHFTHSCALLEHDLPNRFLCHCLNFYQLTTSYFLFYSSPSFSTTVLIFQNSKIQTPFYFFCGVYEDENKPVIRSSTKTQLLYILNFVPYLRLFGLFLSIQLKSSLRHNAATIS